MMHSEHLVLHMISGAHYLNSSVDNSCLLLSYDGTERSAQLHLMSNLARLNSWHREHAALLRALLAQLKKE